MLSVTLFNTTQRPRGVESGPNGEVDLSDIGVLLRDGKLIEGVLNNGEMCVISICLPIGLKVINV